MKTNKFIVIAVVVALILGATAIYRTLGHGVDGLAAATPGSLLIEQYSPYVNQNGGISSALPIQTTSTVTAADISVGTSGTNFTGLVGGSCNLTGMDASQAATTSRAYSCTGITGLTSSFKVIASLSTSTPAALAGWHIVGAKASTTAGAADIVIANLTGAAAVPSATSVGSSTSIFGFK